MLSMPSAFGSAKQTLRDLYYSGRFMNLKDFLPIKWLDGFEGGSLSFLSAPMLFAAIICKRSSNR